MAYDQGYSGTADWIFPSPTATPPTANFTHQSIQTPRTVPFPTHFQDAFSTPQLGVHATPQQHPYNITTPALRTHASKELVENSGYGQVHGDVVPETQRGHHVGYNNQTADTSYSSSHIRNVSSSIQQSHVPTPPPTRGSTIRKSSIRNRPRVLSTSSGLALQAQTSPHKPPLPHTQSDAAIHGSHQPTSDQFSFFDFSTGAGQPDQLGNVSGAVGSSANMSWSGSLNLSQASPQKVLEPPFMPNSSGQEDWSQTSSHSQIGSSTFDTPAMQSFPLMQSYAASAAEFSFTSTFPNPANTAQQGGSVDPSLVYTSPVRPTLRLVNPRLQSYHDPAASLKRKDSTASLRSERPVSHGRDTSNPTGPGLRRSQTYGSLRSKSNSFAAGQDLPLQNSTVRDPPRTASPNKRGGKNPLSSIFEDRPQHRPSIVLMIDENGRARTETRDPALDSPSRAMRDRYPGLYDTDSSDEDDVSGAGDEAPSRNASFSFAKAEERRNKAARLDSPIENLEGLSILRSASAASLRKPVAPSRAALAAAAQLRRVGNIRRPSSVRNLRRRRSNLGSGPISLVSVHPNTASDSTQAGHAQQQVSPPELVSPVSTDSDSLASWYGENAANFDQILAPAVDLTGHDLTGHDLTGHDLTGHGHAENRGTKALAHNWASISFDASLAGPQPWSIQTPVDAYQGHGLARHASFPAPNAAPPPHHASTPATEANPLIHCLCGVTDGTMQSLVQCNSCSSWHHSACVGVHGSRPFTCMFCIKPMHNMMMSAPVSWT